MNKPHVHSELIKRWADGAEVEVLLLNGTWMPAAFPTWDRHIKYRIKPQPKPDIDVVARICFNGREGLFIRPKCIGVPGNVRFIFDDETQELKAVEMIK